MLGHTPGAGAPQQGTTHPHFPRDLASLNVPPKPPQCRVLWHLKTVQLAPITHLAAPQGTQAL